MSDPPLWLVDRQQCSQDERDQRGARSHHQLHPVFMKTRRGKRIRCRRFSHPIDDPRMQQQDRQRKQIDQKFKDDPTPDSFTYRGMSGGSFGSIDSFFLLV